MTSSYVAVVVHYHAVEQVHMLLEDMARWSCRPGVVVVVDNSGEFEHNRDVAAPFRIVVLRQSHNLGYGGAMNRGIQWALSDRGYGYVLLATQDLQMRPTAIEYMLHAAQSDQIVGVVAPLLMYASDPERVFSAGGVLGPSGRTAHVFADQRSVQIDSANKPVAIDWADGACLLISLDALSVVGGFDEAYFLYVEEVDLQLRIKAAGYKVVLHPKAISFQEPGNYDPYYRYRNSIYLSKKFDELRNWPWIAEVFIDLIRCAVGRCTLVQVFHALQGVRDGLLGRMGTPSPRARQ